MMRDRPTAGELLALAAAACGNDGSEAALAARCRAIAAREAEQGDSGFAAIRAELAALYGEQEDGALLTCLAAQLRDGIHDAPGDLRDRVRDLLWRLTVAKLRESNPDFLRT
jgi:hypothetical protein